MAANKSKKKEYIIKVKAQHFTYDNLSSAIERARKIIDAGLWYIEMDENEES